MKNVMKYKGYIGSVEYSDDDSVFYGKIEGIDDLVNFEGDSVASLQAAFHEAVDDYLEFCKEEGKDPNRNYSGCLNIRISPDIHRRVAQLAKQAGVSINSFIKNALERQVAAM